MADGILVDICGQDITHLHKWGTDCYFQCDSIINSVDESDSNLPYYGLIRYHKGVSTTNRRKAFYAYEPLTAGVCLCHGSIGGCCARLHFGVVDLATCQKTELHTELIPKTEVFYWAEFFGVDQNDTMHFLCDYGLYPPVGNDGHDHRQYLKIASDGTLLVNIDVLIPWSGSITYNGCDYVSPHCQEVLAPFCGPGGPLQITCVGRVDTLGACWLTLDGSKIVGLGVEHIATPHVVEIDEPDCSYFFGCGTELDNNIVWAIDTTTGAFSIIGSRPVDPTTTNPINVAILGNQILDLQEQDDSVIVFRGISRDGYIVCEKYTGSDGTWQSTFHIGEDDPLGAACIAIPGTDPIGSVSADIDSEGKYIYLRLNYNSNTPSALNGRVKLFRTRYPMTADSEWIFICSMYATSQSVCHWGQIQTYPGLNNRLAQATLVGAS